MTMRLPLSYGKKHITIISCYAPTVTNTEGVKNTFYEDTH